MAEQKQDEKDNATALSAELTASIPDFSDDLADMTAHKLVKLTVTAVDHLNTITKNTLSREGIKAFAAESDDKEITSARTDFEKAQEEVSKLTEALEKAKNVMAEKEENLISVAESSMAGQIDSEAAATATEELKTTRESMKVWIKALTDSAPESEELTTFIQTLREKALGPDLFASPSPSSNSSAKSESAKIREWALNNGYEVKPKGKIPDGVQEAYYKANPPQK